MVKLSESMPGGSREDERESLYLTVARVKLSGSTVCQVGVQRMRGSVST